jgi:hypothetical protein
VTCYCTILSTVIYIVHYCRYKILMSQLAKRNVKLILKILSDLEQKNVVFISFVCKLGFFGTRGRLKREWNATHAKKAQCFNETLSKCNIRTPDCELHYCTYTVAFLTNRLTKKWTIKWPNVPERGYLTISHIDITNVASVSVALRCMLSIQESFDWRITVRVRS